MCVCCCLQCSCIWCRVGQCPGNGRIWPRAQPGDSGQLLPSADMSAADHSRDTRRAQSPVTTALHSSKYSSKYLTVDYYHSSLSLNSIRHWHIGVIRNVWNYITWCCCWEVSFSFNDSYLSFTTFVEVAMMTHFNISISGRDFLSGGSFQPGERRFGKIQTRFRASS